MTFIIIGLLFAALIIGGMVALHNEAKIKEDVSAAKDAASAVNKAIDEVVKK